MGGMFSAKLSHIVLFFFFFFFKQKTAYEMRISDWSSDVCSSDLRRSRAAAGIDIGLARFRIGKDHRVDRLEPAAAGEERLPTINARTRGGLTGRDAQPARRRMLRADRIIEIIAPVRREHIGRPEAVARRTVVVRSEEQTSELPYLMRNPYAV